VHRGAPGARLLPAALVVAALTRAACVPAATLIISVQSPDGHALAGAVVTARPLDAPGKRLGPVHAVMDQVDRAFAPDLLVIPVGSTVEFPNSDSVSHQIYSFSATKRFKLPLYRGKPYPPVPFDQAGVVTLGCNITTTCSRIWWSRMRPGSAAPTRAALGLPTCRAAATA